MTVSGDLSILALYYDYEIPLLGSVTEKEGPSTFSTQAPFGSVCVSNQKKKVKALHVPSTGVKSKVLKS